MKNLGYEARYTCNEAVEEAIEDNILNEAAHSIKTRAVLILGFLENIPYHVVVAQCEDHARVVTVYKPEENKWIMYRTRR